MTKYGEEDFDLLTEPGVRMPVQGLRRRSPVLIFFTAVLRLVFPAVCLLGVFALSRYADGFPVTLFDRFPSGQAERNVSAWLTGGHFVIPLTFFVIHLTNRAYGAGMAFALALTVWTILTAATIYFPDRIAGFLPWWRALPDGEAAAFAIALFAGHLTAIAVFDLTRGPNWWKAPLNAGIFGAAVYVGLFYGLAPAKPEVAMTQAAVTEGAINLLMAILLLLPYWMLRPVIRPLPGYGGA